MQDFNDFSKNANQGGFNAPQNIMDLVKSLAQKYDGKSQDELFRAVYEEAEKGKREGRLTNADIDNFVNTIYPFLDAKKQKYLTKIAEKLKRI